jgi:hypothetical protein
LFAPRKVTFAPTIDAPVESATDPLIAADDSCAKQWEQPSRRAKKPAAGEIIKRMVKPIFFSRGKALKDLPSLNQGEKCLRLECSEYSKRKKFGHQTI